jgi:FeS assembly protein SufD
MNRAFQKLNAIPIRTWSWLNVNDAGLGQDFPPVVVYKNDPQTVIAPKGVSSSPIAQVGAYPGEERVGPNTTQALKDFTRENRNSGYSIRIAEGQTVERPFCLSYALDRLSPVLIDDTFVLAEKGSKATILIYYSSDAEGAAYHSGVTRVHVEDGAELTLIKVQLLSDGDRHVDHVVAAVDAGAKVQVLLVELGSQESITNCRIDLNGEGAQGLLDSIYLGDQARRIDINYRITHSEKDTISSIHSRGVLAGQCEKVFRGTIDFVSGCSGAKGSEAEHTVLLGPDIRNISTPLLLCGEDDVEGAHAVSTGKIDEDILFYLMTRGLSEVEAKKVVVEASFAPVFEKIEDGALREQIASYVKERLRHV